jgi:hypothetical protein
MKLKLALLVGLFAFGYAMSASAGAVVDADGDLVPDQFDNCKNFDNGPNDGSNQVDTDIDGWGNACDGDFDNTGASTTWLVSGADFTIFVANFGLSTAAARESDLTGDLLISGTDFSRFVALFGSNMTLAGSPSESGLACRGTIPCTP